MTNLQTGTAEFEISDELADRLTRFRRVAVTTGRDDDAMARVRRIVTELATTHDWEIVLYDRSHERWTDHPHPTGPLGIDELDGDDMEHLRRQLSDIAHAGVSATAWIATIPSLTAMIDLFQAVSIDAVFLPGDPEKPRLMERLLEGGDVAETVERVAGNLVPDTAPTFLVVDEDAIRIETYEETS